MSPTPTTPPILPRKLAGRVFRWGAPRFLKVCWLVATGRRGVLAGPAVRLDVAEVDGLEHLPHVAGVLSAMRAGLSPHGGHGLRAILHRLLLFHSRDWFRQLQDNSLAQSVASADGAERAWLDRAGRRGMGNVITSLLKSVARGIDVPDVCPVPWSLTKDTPGAAKPARARKSRSEEERLRARGRSRLLKSLHEHILDAMMTTPQAGAFAIFAPDELRLIRALPPGDFPDLPPPPVRPVSARRPLPVCKPHPVFGKSLSGIP